MINPFPLVVAMVRRHPVICTAFMLLIALAVGIGGAITAQERALRSGSARASDAFDIIVAAPGSRTDILFRVVYLQPGSAELLQGEPLQKLMSEERAAFVAPIGFGDSYEGHPVVGTIADLPLHLSGGEMLDGRVFEAIDEAVVGFNSPLEVGDTFHVSHGVPGAEDDTAHARDLTVVGRVGPTGTPWDRAVMTPIEFTWLVHDLGTGHGNADPIPIGPPFDLETMPGIPAAVIEAPSLGTAYGLRSEYRTPETMAFFPAEVLFELYDILGDVRVVMSALSIATQIILVAAILAGLMILMQLYRQRFAVLRALGASRFYVFAVAWTFGFSLIALGSLVGLGVAALLVGTVSGMLSDASGIAMSTSIAGPEVLLALALTAVGAVLALLPAALLYRKPVVETLRGG